MISKFLTCYESTCPSPAVIRRAVAAQLSNTGGSQCSLKGKCMCIQNKSELAHSSTNFHGAYFFGNAKACPINAENAFVIFLFSDLERGNTSPVRAFYIAGGMGIIGRSTCCSNLS